MRSKCVREKLARPPLSHSHRNRNIDTKFDLKVVFGGSSFFHKFLAGFILGAVVTYVVVQFVPRGIPGGDGFSFCSINSDGDHDSYKCRNPWTEDKLAQSMNETDTRGSEALHDWLNQRVRVLCVVITHPKNLYKKAVHVKATWAKRCNKILYVSSEATDFPTIAATRHEGREYLWQKTRFAFQRIYENHLDEAEWFLKADDDTYVILENLRKLLSQHDPDEPIYFGRKLKPGFMSGGAGYVLSRGTVRFLGEKGFRDTSLCKSRSYVGYHEDVEMWNCLTNLGVQSGDSRDGKLETFHPLVPEEMIVPGILPRSHWYLQMNFYPPKEGRECCSNYSISFHYVPPETMYFLEYMVYHLRPFGIQYYACPTDDIKYISPVYFRPERPIHPE